MAISQRCSRLCHKRLHMDAIAFTWTRLSNGYPMPIFDYKDWKFFVKYLLDNLNHHTATVELYLYQDHALVMDYLYQLEFVEGQSQRIL